MLRGRCIRGTCAFLSTPSARRATYRCRVFGCLCPISIHALREEGDYVKIWNEWFRDEFLSTPSARRATVPFQFLRILRCNFYPRPPRGGRPTRTSTGRRARNFYPRPPRGGRRAFLRGTDRKSGISIHALREEGDWHDRRGRRRADCISIHALREEGDSRTLLKSSDRGYFYPRPPRGGRLFDFAHVYSPLQFLSTPSARRATQPLRTHRHHLSISIHALREEGDFAHLLRFLASNYFYPRPPRGGRPVSVDRDRISLTISIHALREEGDPARRKAPLWKSAFLSTPSARRATGVVAHEVLDVLISIHALREEGDFASTSVPSFS